MVERLNLAARWAARKESSAACADRALKFLRQIGSLDETFAQTWRGCGMSLKEALANKVELSPRSVQALLEKGRNRRDRDNTVIEDLGFSFGTLWNGREDEAAHLTVHCGAYPDPTILPAPNELLIEFPYEGEAATRFREPSLLNRFMISAAECWDPDWARVSIYQMDEALYGQGLYKGQKVGLITYITDRYGPLPLLPEDCAVERVDGVGNVITITSITEQLTASNPAHVAAIQRLSDALERKGVRDE